MGLLQAWKLDEGQERAVNGAHEKAAEGAQGEAAMDRAARYRAAKQRWRERKQARSMTTSGQVLSARNTYPDTVASR